MSKLHHCSDFDIGLASFVKLRVKKEKYVLSMGSHHETFCGYISEWPLNYKCCLSFDKSFH